MCVSVCQYEICPPVRVLLLCFYIFAERQDDSFHSFVYAHEQRQLGIFDCNMTTTKKYQPCRKQSAAKT